MEITSGHFGVTGAGEEVQLFSLINDQGMDVRITNYGGIIVAIYVPDLYRKLGDVVLGHETLEGYLNRSRYFGALVGRYANRIAQGRFCLHGTAYSLAKNNGENHLHGGLKGFDKVVWRAREIPASNAACLKLAYLSKDGEEGYPGNLETSVTYVLTSRNE